jgi:hypothetical protein
MLLTNTGADGSHSEIKNWKRISLQGDCIISDADVSYKNEKVRLMKPDLRWGQKKMAEQQINESNGCVGGWVSQATGL